jgi:hypothetical protein
MPKFGLAPLSGESNPRDMERIILLLQRVRISNSSYVVARGE